MPLSWSATKEETEIIRKILDRAEALGIQDNDLMSLHMDIEATHCNGCPLKLAELLEAPDFDFVHDVAGIRRHLNRETGELEDCFLPRFAAPEREATT